MPRIFISYRCNDSANSAGRIYDRLEGRFSQSQVFMDVDTIKPGVNFVEVGEQAVSACYGLVELIGRERTPKAMNLFRECLSVFANKVGFE